MPFAGDARAGFRFRSSGQHAEKPYRLVIEADALAHSRRLLATREGFVGLELWQEARSVFLYPRDAMA